jgi:hypothetical protein
VAEPVTNATFLSDICLLSKSEELDLDQALQKSTV